MDTDKKEIELLEKNLTEKIIGASFKVHNALGCGFLEKVYENALAVELNHLGIAFQQQPALKVKYEGVIVGDYQADMVIDDRVILELQAVSTLDSVHEAQLLNYLKATGLQVGLLINFAKPKLQFKRFVA